MPGTEVKTENIDVDGFNIAALRSGEQTNKHHKILCLHGWLDNANSFLPLLPLINNADIVAIDLPGHGHSDHQNTLYSVASEAHRVLTIADALGWNEFTLLGHSLGGCIAPFATAIAPERINQLITIEAVGPRAESPEELPVRLKNYHHDMQHPKKYQSRLFDTLDQAVESRLRANKMKAESAHLIIERQVKETEVNNQKKFQWRFDSNLRVTSPGYFTEPQVQAILKEISCPTLCVLAEQGYVVERPETGDRLNCIADIQVVKLPGFHHLHLDNPIPVAKAINSFLIKAIH